MALNLYIEDTELAEALVVEAAARISGDDDLQTQINSEAAARVTGDTLVLEEAGVLADAAEVSAKAYADTLVTSVFRSAGGWDASVGTWPTSGTGSGGGIRRGDSYNVTVAGSIGSKEFDVGDVFYANQATPGQVDANWATFEANTQQATESYRGTVREATQAVVENALTVNQTDYVSPRKLWLALAASWSVTGFRDAVRATLLTGLVTTDATDVAATDGVVVAFGKLKRRLNDLIASVAASLDTKAALSEVNTYTESHVLALTDADDTVLMNVAGANTCEVPLNATAAFRIGTQIKVIQYGAGKTTITAAGGVTLKSLGGWVKLAAVNAHCVLTKTGTNEWFVDGALVP